jgi:hypothetical protein
MEMQIAKERLSFTDDLIAGCPGEGFSFFCRRRRWLPRLRGEYQFADVTPTQ